MSLVSIFRESARRYAKRPALIHSKSGAVSFEALEARASLLAGAFRQRGIEKGDRVLVAMPLGPDLYAALAALWWLGAVSVLPEPALGLSGLRHAAKTTSPKAYLSSGWLKALRYLVPELRSVPVMLTPSFRMHPALEPVALTGRDPALISFTSGSTHAPKAMERSHGLLQAQFESNVNLLTPRPEGDIDLVAFPVFVLANVALGITSVLPDWKMTRPDRVSSRHILKRIHRYGVTRLMVPPVICEALARTELPARLHKVFTGGGPVFPEMVMALKSRSPHVKLISIYGSTEAEPIAHLDTDDIRDEDWRNMRSGAGLLAGSPVPEIALRLDEGEVIVSGDHVNESYLDPSRNAETKLSMDGRIWHRTGDAARLDGEGRLWLLGRVGRQVEGAHGPLYPFSVEVAARFWPGVVRAALVERGGKSLLVIEGRRGFMADWRERALGLGIGDIYRVKKIPMDKRHRSKVDYQALAQLI